MKGLQGLAMGTLPNVLLKVPAPLTDGGVLAGEHPPFNGWLILCFATGRVERRHDTPATCSTLQKLRMVPLFSS
jgi:hypothetical protein